MSGIRVEPSLNRNLCPLENLARGEKLIINALRKWLFNSRTLPRIARRFQSELGPAPGHLAMEGFLGAAELLSNESRRVVFFRYPSCTKISTDERSIITLISAAQHNDYPHMAALARWLFVPASQRRAISQFTILAFALRDGGCLLARPVNRIPPPKQYTAELKAVV